MSTGRTLSRRSLSIHQSDNECLAVFTIERENLGRPNYGRRTQRTIKKFSRMNTLLLHTEDFRTTRACPQDNPRDGVKCGNCARALRHRVHFHYKHNTVCIVCFFGRAQCIGLHNNVYSKPVFRLLYAFRNLKRERIVSTRLRFTRNRRKSTTDRHATNRIS